jgi:hypothetical protein
MMKDMSPERDASKRGARLPATSRINAARGVSALALGRSLGLRVMPGLFLGCIAIAVPENQVGAMEGVRGTPQVRVPLQALENVPEHGPAVWSSAAGVPRSRRAQNLAVLQEVTSEVGSAAAITVPVRSFSLQSDTMKPGVNDEDRAFKDLRELAGSAWRDDLAAGKPRTPNAARSRLVPMSITPGLVDVDTDGALRPEIAVPKENAGSAAGLTEQSRLWSAPAIAYAPVVIDPSLEEVEVTFGTAGVQNPSGPGSSGGLPTVLVFADVSGRQNTGSERKRTVPPLRSVLSVPDVDLLRPEDPAAVLASTHVDVFSANKPSDPATGVAEHIGEVAIATDVAATESAPSDKLGEMGLAADFRDSIPSVEAYLGGAAPQQGSIVAAGVTASPFPMPGSELKVSPATADDGSQAIPLRTLVELFSNHFEPDELERFRQSPAIDTAVPLSAFEDAELELAAAYSGDPAMMGLSVMQAAPSAAGEGPRGSGGNSGMFSGFTQSLVATASAGFDSNPFLGTLDDASAASVRLQLVPTLSRSSERNTFRLSGRAEHIEYLGRYRSLQNYGADVATSHKVTERLEIDAGLLFSSNVLATNVANPFFVDDLSPDAPLPPSGNDITILGQGQRRTQFGADAGLTYTLSERDQLRWTLTGRADRFDQSGLTESNFIAQQLQYSRQLDEGLTVGAIVDVGLIDFVGATDGKARTVSPQLQVRAALTPRLEVSGSVGLAITRLEFDGLEETTTAFAGNVSICNQGERSNICITGSRQVLPAAVGGALVQTRAGVSYSLRLSERDTVQLNANYATASRPVTSIGPSDFESINGYVRYERQLDERMRLFVSTGYLNTSGNLPVDATNFQALVGVTFNLGRTK